MLLAGTCGHGRLAGRGPAVVSNQQGDPPEWRAGCGSAKCISEVFWVGKPTAITAPSAGGMRGAARSTVTGPPLSESAQIAEPRKLDGASLPISGAMEFAKLASLLLVARS